MTTQDYQKQAKRTDAPLSKNYDEIDSLHMVLGMVTEVGELADPFKKNLAYGRDIDWINVEEELGDLMWYIAVFCEKHNLDLSELMQRNIDKLKERFPEKFDTDKAINRNTDNERKILEKGGH